MPKAVFALSLLAALTAGPALAQDALPNGLYDCQLDGKSLGSFLMNGGSYQGPALDGNFGEPERYIVMEGGKIEWLGAMPSLDAAGYRIDHTTIRAGAAGAPGFDLVLLLPDESGFVTAACDIKTS